MLMKLVIVASHREPGIRLGTGLVTWADRDQDQGVFNALQGSKIDPVSPQRDEHLPRMHARMHLLRQPQQVLRHGSRF